MRAIIKLVLLGLMVFAAAFLMRRIFFWDVMPMSWNEESSPTGALMAAYLLLSLENVAVAVAAIALVTGLVLSLGRWRRSSHPVQKSNSSVLANR
jgi:hypothetical protein